MKTRTNARILRPGGRLIIDIRAERMSDSFKQIKEAVGPMLCQFPAAKHSRCVFARRG